MTAENKPPMTKYYIFAGLALIAGIISYATISVLLEDQTGLKLGKAVMFFAVLGIFAGIRAIVRHGKKMTGRLPKIE